MTPAIPIQPFQPPPPPPAFAGLPEPLWTVIYWAGQIGMAIEEAVEKCRLMLWGDVDLLRAANDDWNALAGKIAAGRDELVRTGNDVLTSWTGTSADAFAKYLVSVEKSFTPLTDVCTKIAKALSTASVEVGKLRTTIVIACGATVVAIGVATAAAFGTFGLTLTAIPAIIGAWVTAMIALWVAYSQFFNAMAAAFDDVEPSAEQLAALKPGTVLPPIPTTVTAVEGWDIKFNS